MQRALEGTMLARSRTAKPLGRCSAGGLLRSRENGDQFGRRDDLDIGASEAGLVPRDQVVDLGLCGAGSLNSILEVAPVHCEGLE